MTCPHCHAEDLDPGATGLDLCRRCGGLSRHGALLSGHTPFAPFAEPELRDLQCAPVDGVVVAAVSVGGVPGILVTFRAGTTPLGPFLLTGQRARNLVALARDALAHSTARARAQDN